MGATPTHQAYTKALDHELWDVGTEDALPVPPRMEIEGGMKDDEGMLKVEAGAVSAHSRQKRHADGSPGSTALASTLAMRGPWSRTTSVKEWYPDCYVATER